MSPHQAEAGSTTPRRFSVPPSLLKGGISLAIAVGLVVTSLWLLTPGTGIWYLVQPDEAGLVRTFGVVTDVTGPGLHFKAPYPIQQAYTEPLTRVMRVEFGFRTVRPGGPDEPAEYRDIPDLMLTQDENILDMEFIVQFRPKDVLAWHLNVAGREKTVQKAAEAIMAQVVGTHPIDDVLTENKTQIQLEAQSKLQELLDRYQIGVVVLNVKLQDIQPPGAVRAAFKAVQDAKEQRQKYINEAQAYANKQLAQTQGQVEQIKQDALADKFTRVEQARGDVAKFTQVLAEYSKAPEVTRTRLYYEMIKSTLPQLENIYFMDAEGTVKYLPLERLVRGESQ